MMVIWSEDSYKVFYIVLLNMKVTLQRKLEKLQKQHWRKCHTCLVQKRLARMLHCLITIGNFTQILFLNTSEKSSSSGHLCFALHVVKVMSRGEKSLFYPDGWCRGRTRWWRCGSRAPRSPLASPAGGIYSGSRRTRSSLGTSRSTQALGSCCTNVCNLKIIMKEKHSHLTWQPRKSL